MSDSFNGNGSSGSKLFYLQNKAPKWDEAHGGHVLNFQVSGLCISLSGNVYFDLLTPLGTG